MPNLNISNVHWCLTLHCEMLDLNLDDMHRNYCNQTSRASPPLLIVQSTVIYYCPAERLFIFWLIIPVGGDALHSSVC